MSSSEDPASAFHHLRISEIQNAATISESIRFQTCHNQILARLNEQSVPPASNTGRFVSTRFIGFKSQLPVTHSNIHAIEW